MVAANWESLGGFRHRIRGKYKCTFICTVDLDGYNDPKWSRYHIQ